MGIFLVSLKKFGFSSISQIVNLSKYCPSIFIFPFSAITEIELSKCFSNAEIVKLSEHKVLESNSNLIVPVSSNSIFCIFLYFLKLELIFLKSPKIQ